MTASKISQNLESVLTGRDIDWCAKRLLGAKIVRQTNVGSQTAIIVETESYDQSDPASHSYKPTQRSQVMFGPAGLAYIYLIYGMYYCLNVVCGPINFGAGVLIRAARPVSGFDKPSPRLDGPGKLCRELRIDLSFQGHNLDNAPLQIVLSRPLSRGKIVSTPRVGLSQSLHALKRFYVYGSPFISRR